MSSFQQFALCFLLFVGCTTVHAQYNQGGTPKSFLIAQEENSIGAQIAQRDFNKISVAPPSDEIKTAILSDREKGPYYMIECNIDFMKEATKETLEDGTWLYRLAIESVGAKSLCFFFSKFKVFSDGEFYLFDADKKVVKGKFNFKSMNSNGGFGISDTQGSKMILEYYAPNEIDNDVEIIIDAIEYEIKQ